MIRILKAIAGIGWFVLQVAGSFLVVAVMSVSIVLLLTVFGNCGGSP